MEMVKHRKGVYERYIKRLFDIVCSGVALVALSPVILVVSAIVHKKLGSPVIFTQERPGLNGKVFTLYKFRTMTDQKDEWGHYLPDKARLTPFGAKLRSTSLDELPELWNIFKGEMSVVGPRPLRVEYLGRYNEKQRHRHDVKPGLTGLAQVNGRNAITWERRFEYDIEYVQNICFLLDAKIIFKTIGIVIRKTGISSGSSSTMEPFMGSDAETK